MKKSGRGDTEHRREIAKSDLDLIEDQLVVLLNIMRARDERNYDKYWDLIKQIKPEWRDKYNYLLQYGAMYIIMTATAKRANEGKIALVFVSFDELIIQSLNLVKLWIFKIIERSF